MNIAVIYGGKSCEHDVSIVTGVQILNAISELNPLAIYIDRQEVWRSGKNMTELSTYKRPEKLRKVFMQAGSDFLYNEHGKKLTKLDAIVLCCHGNGGEDGCLQGFLELCGVPYTGADVLGSALCANKPAMKKYLGEEFPIVPYTSFSREEFNKDIYKVAERLNKIGYPFIVKPASLGSSIGVGTARSEAELVEAVRVAFAFDDYVICEKLLENFRELNCAALGDESEVTVSEVEEPLGWKEFLSFEDKYAGGKSDMTRRLPADIESDVRDNVRKLTELAFKRLGLSGVVRADFMLSEEGKLYLNEINTLPGSLAAYFYRYEGMTEVELVKKLVEIARKRYDRKDRLTYSYTSPVLHSKSGD